MKPSPARVARKHLTKLASTGSIDDYLQDEWLPAIGAQMARRVSGEYGVEFNKGLLLWVRTRDVPVLWYGLRVRWSRGCTVLKLFISSGGSGPEEIGELPYNDFASKKPRQIADWAVELVQGRGQADLFLDEREQDQKLLEEARAIVYGWERNNGKLPFSEKKRRIQQELERLRRERRR